MDGPPLTDSRCACAQDLAYSRKFLPSLLKGNVAAPETKLTAEQELEQIRDTARANGARSRSGHLNPQRPSEPAGPDRPAAPLRLVRDLVLLLRLEPGAEPVVRAGRLGRALLLRQRLGPMGRGGAADHGLAGPARLAAGTTPPRRPTCSRDLNRLTRLGCRSKWSRLGSTDLTRLVRPTI